MAVGIDTSIVDAAASATTQNKKNNSLDKDAFLQLLVTQMQYQDPLEPTSNTEYMSQLAQFSSVEELQNINNTFSTNQSLNLAGQYVILNVPDSSGEISQVSGLVDYVTVSDGKAYFSINDEYYPADYLDSVVSLDYLEHLINSSKPTEDGTDTDNNEETENTDDTSQTEKTE